MSLQFSDTPNKDGILQRIEQEVGFSDGVITGDATLKAIWTGSINLALDRVFGLIFSADGRWQFDDSNHTKNPFIYTDLTINTRVYNFLADQQNNLILDIFAVYARSSITAPYYLLNPVDAQSDIEPGNSNSMVDGLNATGWPSSYDKTGNGIRLDLLPPSTVVNGLQIFINREGSYFVVGDTIKTPGFNGLFHEYLVLEPSYRYARAKNLSNREVLKRDVLEMEEKIIESYSRRSKDERTMMVPEPIFYE